MFLRNVSGFIPNYFDVKAQTTVLFIFTATRTLNRVHACSNSEHNVQDGNICITASLFGMTEVMAILVLTLKDHHLKREEQCKPSAF
jgi:hypothetical protein